MRDYNIAIYSTGNRSIIYINDMLDALVKLNKEIHVFIDGDSDQYITVNNPLICHHLLSPTEFTQQQTRITKHKASYNYCRCLNFEPNKDILILEDDIIVNDDFLNVLEMSLGKIHEETFVLSLCHNWHELGHLAAPKEQVIQPFTNLFLQKQIAQMIEVNTKETINIEIHNLVLVMWCNLQCVYYPAGQLRANVVNYINEEQPKFTGDEMFDFIIGSYCYKNNIPVYITTEPAGKHIGAVRAIG